MADQDTECVPYSETLWEEFDRLSDMCRPGSDVQVINLSTVYGSDVGMKTYGLGNHARYGDNTEDCSSINGAAKKARCESWDSYNG